MTTVHESVRAGEDLERAKAVGSTLLLSTPIALPDELPPVKAFPLDALPDAFRGYVTDISERMNCPPDFVAVPLLVAAASLVARHVGIRPQAHTDWTERGGLWALIVGRPGVMKSPAMQQALAPLYRLENQAAEDHQTAHNEFVAGALERKLRADQRTKNAVSILSKDAGADLSGVLSRGDDDAPIRQRYVVADTTYEKLGELLVQNPGGLLSVRDEMRGLFSHLAREEQATARAFYLTAWGGGSYHFDRIGRGSVTIEDARLSMIGGIQPGPIGDLLRQARRGAADDGMIERFLIAYPDQSGTWRNVDRWPDSESKRKVWQVFERLNAFSAEALNATRDTAIDGTMDGLAYLRLRDDARDAFLEWREEFEGKIRDAETESLEGALAKFKHHVPALALVQHVVDGGVGPATLVAMARALALADYFESHARRLHASERRATVRGAKTILAKIRDGSLPEVFSARNVQMKGWSGLDEKVAVANALDLLVDCRWLVETDLQPGPQGGRPKTVYMLHEGAQRE